MKLRTKILKKRKRKRRSDFDHLRTDGGGGQMSEEKYLCPDDVCLQLMKKDPDTDRTNAAILAKNIVLEKRNEFLEKGISFITETVFCHESHLAFMKKAKKAGYNVRLIYVATDSPDINVARVKKRVRQGGHNVEEEKIRSRYYRSLALLKKAVDIADTAEIRDNSTEGELAKTCAVKMFGNVYIVSDEHGWVKKYLE